MTLVAAGLATLGLAPGLARAQQGDANAGKPVYDAKCALCHGVKGDGKGPAAELLLPQPRDFTSGVYKIRTSANKVPTDQDIFRMISNGMPGTSMPAWDVLPERDRWNLVAYIKTFAGDKLKEPLRANLQLTQNTQHQCRFRNTLGLGGESVSSCVPFIDFRNRTVNLTLDTHVSDLVVGLQMGYTARQDYVGTRRANSQFNLGIFANFELPVGQLPTGQQTIPGIEGRGGGLR